MTDHIPDELSPAGRGLRAYTDELRPEHPVVRNDRGEWVLLRHDLVRRAALDDLSFSNGVSRFLQVPNGLDGSMHTAFREALDPFLAPAALAPYRAGFERIAAVLVRSLPRAASVEAVREIGAAFAVRAQSDWLGWSSDLEGRLLAWIEDNRAAARSGDRMRATQVAEEFDDIIRSVVAERRPDPPRSTSPASCSGSRCTGASSATPRSCRCCATGPAATSAPSRCASECWCTIWPATASCSPGCATASRTPS